MYEKSNHFINKAKSFHMLNQVHKLWKILREILILVHPQILHFLFPKMLQNMSTESTETQSIFKI